MQQYLDLAKDILANGKHHSDRTGVGTTRVFGRQMRFNLREGFPLLTTKKMFVRGVFLELFWMLRGETNNNWLTDRGVHIWDEWAKEDGSMGPIYGAQWRNFDGKDSKHVGTDQLEVLLNEIKHNPNSRRLMLTAWNPNQIIEMSLPACHCLVQFQVEDENILHCHLYQRSADLFLGVPFNIASYALLTHLIAHVSGLSVGDFIHTFGDVHIYDNHKEALATQFEREPMELPRLKIDLPFIKNSPEAIGSIPLEVLEGLDEIDIGEGIQLVGYNSHPTIKADVAV